MIKSQIRDWVYVGFTSDINKRLNQHNGGYNRSTKAYRPFDLIFVQIEKDREKARELEKYLKVRYNKESVLAGVLKLVDKHA